MVHDKDAEVVLDNLKHKWGKYNPKLIGGLVRKKKSKDIDILINCDQCDSSEIHDFMRDVQFELFNVAPKEYQMCNTPHLNQSEFEDCIKRNGPRIDVFLPNKLECSWKSKKGIVSSPFQDKEFELDGFDVFSTGGGLHKDRGYIRSDYFDLVVDYKLLKEELNNMNEKISYEYDNFTNQERTGILEAMENVKREMDIYTERVFPILGIKMDYNDTQKTDTIISMLRKRKNTINQLMTI